MRDTTENDLDIIQNILEKLEAIGIATDAGDYDSVWEAMQRVDQLYAHASAFSRDERATLDAVTRSLASNPGDYETSIPRVLAAAMTGYEGVSDQVLQILDRATSLAAGDVIRRFRKKGPRTVELLAARLANLTEQARANTIDVGIQDLETAARSGLSTQWLALERTEADFHTIQNILATMRDRRHAVAGVVWAEKDTLKQVPSVKQGAGGVYLAAALAAGADLRILTDDEWTTTRRDLTAQAEIERRRAARAAAQAGEDARTAAAAKVDHPKPKPARIA